MSGLFIGELARRAAVPVSTIRFYERKGLIEKPACRESGYRIYPEAAAERLRFIRHAQESGFTLHQIHRLLRLQSEPDACSGEVRQEAEASIEDVRSKITALQGMESSLQRLLSCCTDDRPACECPIISELQSTDGGTDETKGRSVYGRLRHL